MSRLRTSSAAALAAVVLVAAGCGGGVDKGGMTSGDRKAAQAALDALHGSNIPLQLVGISTTAGEPPAACRVHVESRHPARFSVYVFWIPYTGAQTYSWLNMTIAEDAKQDTFHLGTGQPALPGGILAPNGESILPGTADYDTPLSHYGPQQARKNEQVLRSHAGDTFAKPTARCIVLMNGDLRLLPT
ncbi:MAG: hypothetical protein JO186_11400 [Actinobacteria bacterium]|nr:hypothetical protein [Actinomycetota bacterium]MBV8395084.1 hypothetical protein [Actinomycetota bacterium]